jgi:hypothetical protein
MSQMSCFGAKESWCLQINRNFGYFITLPLSDDVISCVFPTEPYLVADILAAHLMSLFIH